MCAVIIGEPDTQVIVALDRRLLVIKSGWRAGATGGGRAVALRYEDISGIQTNTGITMGTLVILTAGVNTTTGDFWAAGGHGASPSNTSSRKLGNSIPIAKRTLKVYAPDLELMRTFARDGGLPQHSEDRVSDTVADSGPVADDLANHLGRLAELHREGTLDDEEFAAAKRQVLGS